MGAAAGAQVGWNVGVEALCSGAEPAAVATGVPQDLTEHRAGGDFCPTFHAETRRHVEFREAGGT